MVAWLHFGDTGADVLDNAGSFVAEHDRLRHRVDLVADNHIGVAHAGRDDAHQHFVVTRLPEPKFLDDEWAAFFAYDGSAHGVRGSLNGHRFPPHANCSVRSARRAFASEHNLA
jgi:hypothetical protein